MNNTIQYLEENLSTFRGGTLRMFGDWFGRPCDNFHKPTDFKYEDDVLTIIFDNAESLTIWSPRRIKVEHNSIVIKEAVHVRWEWFYYGKPQVEENKFYLDYQKSKKGIETDTNVNWFSPPFTTSKNEPAVQIG